MRVVKLETWRRLTRLELQELVSELSAAAMATINSWPENGEGRAVKAACERAIRALAQVNEKDIADGFGRLTEVVEDLRAATSSDFFRENIGPRKLRSGRWKGIELGTVVESVLGGISSQIAENISFLPVRAAVSSAPEVPQPVVQKDPLARVTPPQQIGPYQFEVRRGYLRIQPQSASRGERNPEGAEQARLQLTNDAAWLVDALRQSNVDRRAIAIVEDIHDQLEAKLNVVRVGITNIACEQIIPSVEEMVAEPVIARLNAFNVGVSLYVSQFEAWHQFVDNAADRDVRVGDSTRAFKVGRRLVADLKANPEFADPEVPRSLEFLMEALSKPERASKRAIFGLFRTIENLLAKIFAEFGGIIQSASDGVKVGLKKGVTIAVAVTALSIAATAAGEIAPSAKHVLKTDWLKRAAEIVSKGLEELK